MSLQPTQRENKATRQASLNATSKAGDVWTGETQDGFYIYTDKNGNLYKSKERPAYRIVMDNAIFDPRHGIMPRNFVDEICKLGDGPISKFADLLIQTEYSQRQDDLNFLNKNPK